MYADDTTILTGCKSVDDIQTNITSLLRNLSTWFRVNRLSLNLTKTVIMPFVKTHAKFLEIKRIAKIQFETSDVNLVDHVKFLGVYLDPLVSFSFHVDHLCSTLARICGCINRLKNTVPRQILKTIYQSFFLSKLTYCIEIWGHTTLGNLAKAERINIRAVKNVLGLKRISNNILHEWNLFSIKDWVSYKTNIIMYNIKNNLAPNRINNLFIRPSDVHNYSTRTDFHVGQQSLKPSFLSTAIHYWNSLPQPIRLKPSIGLFKSTLKKYYLQLPPNSPN